MQSFWHKLPKPIIALAPMAGITDSSFRLLCREHGADVVYTEMVSVAGLTHGSENTKRFLQFNKKERPVVLQLFGSRPEEFVQASKLVAQAGFDGIDINFGCPAKKVNRNDAGCTLMNNLDRVYDIIQATCEATKLPVSIKLRNGKGQVTAEQLVKKVLDLPIQAIMVHGRTFEQAFSGESDWQQIKKIRTIYPGILLANGGLDTPAKAQSVITELAVDGIGIGQGCWGKPWFFSQIKEQLRFNRYTQPTWAQIKRILLTHAELMAADKNNDNLVEFRKHVLRYVNGHEKATALRKQLVTINSYQDLVNIIQQF